MVTIYQALYNEVYVNSLIHSSNWSNDIATIITLFYIWGKWEFLKI